MSVRIDENTDHMKYTDDMEAIDSAMMQTFIQQKMSKKHWQQKLVMLIISKPYYRQRHCRFWKKSHRKHRKRQENILETL